MGLVHEPAETVGTAMGLVGLVLAAAPGRLRQATRRENSSGGNWVSSLLLTRCRDLLSRWSTLRLAILSNFCGMEPLIHFRHDAPLWLFSRNWRIPGLGRKSSFANGRLATPHQNLLPTTEMLAPGWSYFRKGSQQPINRSVPMGVLHCSVQR